MTVLINLRASEYKNSFEEGMSAAANFCIGVVQIVGVEWRLGVLEMYPLRLF